MIIGFTGTRKGMTSKQRFRFLELLNTSRPKEIHHGDCLGADAEFHEVVRAVAARNKWRIHIVGHPPVKEGGRAFCQFDYEHPPFEYIKRDHDIVDVADQMFACAKTDEEELRSGTWATVRYAVRTGTPVVVVWPDGTTERR